MSKNSESGTPDENGNRAETVIDVANIIEELELEASGMENLLGMVAEEEDDKGEEKFAAEMYLFVNIQNHIVKSLHKAEEKLEQEISAKEKVENAPSI
jgi:hypothetical protein